MKQMKDEVLEGQKQLGDTIERMIRTGFDEFMGGTPAEW